MKPRHFWWLVEGEMEKTDTKPRISSQDKKSILEALQGNPKGQFW